MTWEKALQSDMTTSSDEKQTKATLALQSSIRKGLLNFDGVEDATVYINRPKDDGTIYADKQDTSVSGAYHLKWRAAKPWTVIPQMRLLIILPMQ